jgi:hypothetical protein
VTVLLMGCGAPSTPSASSSTATAGTNVRVLARFTVLRSGALSPPTVTVPAHIPIELVVIAADGRAHRALLHIPNPRPLAVPKSRPAEQLIPALPRGSYPLDIDGRRRGTLRVGG